MTVSSVPGGISKKWLYVLAVIGALLALLVGRSLSRLLWQVLFAAALAALAQPLCRRMEKRLPRALASAIAVGALLALVLGVIGLLIPHIIEQVTLIIAEAPRLMTQLQSIWEALAREERLAFLGLDPEAPKTWMASAAGWISNSLPSLIAGIGAAADAVSRAFLSPLLAYYFLRDREVFCYRLSLWIPIRHRRRMLTALREMRREAGGYLRGQGLVALAVAVLTAVGLWIVGIPAWLALGILMGLCEWIPYVGPLIGGIPIALFALPSGWNAVLWALGVTIAVQQIEGFFLSPWLMAGATGLHPVYVVLLLSAGGLLWGLPGMMIALPAFVCVRGAARVFYESGKNFSFFPQK